MITRTQAATILVAYLTMVNATPSVAATSTLRIGYDSWVGFAGVFAADSLGLFEKEGIRVQLHAFPGPTDSIPPVIAGSLDIALTTPDNVISVDARQGEDLRTIDFIDRSAGADAVVAKNDIHGVTDLRDHRIAVTLGQCNELLLLEALAGAGLKQKDVTLVNMDGDIAGAAFIAGSLDAAVTWEPWVTQITATRKGHVVFSSRDAPNTIFDSVAVTARFARTHGPELVAFIRAVSAGTAYVRQHPAETRAILAQRLGIRPENAAVMLRGVQIFDLQDNVNLFRDGQRPGPIYAAMERVADFQFSQHLYTQKAKSASTLDPSFVIAAAAR